MIPGQMNIDDLMRIAKHIEPIEKLKVGSCFSGVGMWELALKYLGIKHTQEFFIEWDKYPAASYKAIHGDVLRFEDATKVKGDELPDIDLFFYSPPCQAFSVAGKGLGAEEERGVLFNDALRIIKAKKPKICIMENVKGLTNAKHSEFFKHIIDSLQRAGYTNHVKVLNTKNFGVPQNRERIFIVSIHNDIYNGFEFPQEFDNGVRLKDLLEYEVDEKYYLSEEYLKRFLASKPISMTDIKILGTTVGSGKGTNSRHWVHDPEGIVGALSATDYKQPKQVLIRTNNSKGYAIAHECDSINLEHPNSETRRGRVGVAQTLTTSCNQAVVEDRIRKFTEKECFRLQGIKDADFDRAAQVNSRSQLYKQAGNGVSVNVVMELIKQLQEFGYLTKGGTHEQTPRILVHNGH